MGNTRLSFALLLLAVVAVVTGIWASFLALPWEGAATMSCIMVAFVAVMAAGVVKA